MLNQSDVIHQDDDTLKTDPSDDALCNAQAKRYRCQLFVEMTLRDQKHD